MELHLIVSDESTTNPAVNKTPEQTPAFSFDKDAVARQVCREALEFEGCKENCQVSLTYVGDEEIQAMNRDYRGIDRITDVLSFPNLPFEGAGGPQNWELLEDSMIRMESTDPETGEIVLGDIVLNLDRVVTQAGEYGHSVKREFAFLIAHSMLHLCGYDHMTEEDAAVMFQRQEEILDRLQITRQQ